MVQVDAEGELYSAPGWLSYVWVVLAILTVAEAVNELLGIGGPLRLYQVWFHDLVISSATALVLVRAGYEPSTRKAWLAFGLAMATWTIGSIAWDIVYGGRSHAPYPTFADALWLLWYPLMAAGIVFLIRFRVSGFELHRWLDGIAVTLVALAAGFALVVQPAADHASGGLPTTIVSFAYPVLDVMLIGAVLGVYGLLGWKPDGMWILIGVGVVTIAIADARFALLVEKGAADDGRYDFIWTVGALMIASAAWVHSPSGAEGSDQVSGMRAIALALIAQALAMAIQIYAIFHEIGTSERVVTVVVLLVASAQIILTRPRPEPPDPELPTGEEPDQ